MEIAVPSRLITRSRERFIAPVCAAVKMQQGHITVSPMLPVLLLIGRVHQRAGRAVGAAPLSCAGEHSQGLGGQSSPGQARFRGAPVAKCGAELGAGMLWGGGLGSLVTVPPVGREASQLLLPVPCRL